MATVKFLLESRYKPKNQNPDEIKYPLVIRVSHKSLLKSIPLGYKFRADQWDNENKGKHTA